MPFEPQELLEAILVLCQALGDRLENVEGLLKKLDEELRGDDCSNASYTTQGSGYSSDGDGCMDDEDFTGEDWDPFAERKD